MAKKLAATIVFLISSSLACAQFKAQVVSVNQTQAIMLETGFNGPCTIQLSTSATLSPSHPDVSESEYTGSSVDISRNDTVVAGKGTMRIVTLGHTNSDRALAVSTTYFYSVSGCGTASGTFSTPTLSSGVTQSVPSPIDTTKWGNLDFPSFDWTTPRTYTDPMTGVQLKPLNLQTGSWRTGCLPAGCTAGNGVLNFTDWSGSDGGWTNPQALITGGTATIAATNTTPIYLWPDLAVTSGPFAFGLPLPYDLHRELDDVGLVFSASTTGIANDGALDFCIVFNPVDGCISGVTNLIATSTFGPVIGEPTDIDGAFPFGFPKIGAISDWARNVSFGDPSRPLFKMDNLETNGTATASGNQLIIANPTPQIHFSNALHAGSKIFIAGSSPGCTNNLCTVAAAPTTPGTITLVETPPSGTVTFRAYGWGIRIWRQNPGSTGTLTFKVGFKLAGSGTPIGVQSNGDFCSSVPQTSSDGKTGYLCYFTTATFGAGVIEFVATDGTVRLVTSSSAVFFDNTQGNVWYNGASNSNGGYTIIRNTYNGNYSTGIDYGYLCSPNNGCPSITPSGCSTPYCVTTTDLMPHFSSSDLDQQIEANQGVTLPAYDSSLYGQWVLSNPQVQFAAVSGQFATFVNTYSGQSSLPNPGGSPVSAGGPGWIAVIDLSQNPAKVTKLLHTLDGTGNPSMRYSGLHSSQGVTAVPNTIGTSGDMLNTQSTSVLFGGPFAAQVVSVLESDGVTWNPITTLPGPPWTSVTYYTTCPSNSLPYTDCVTFRLPQGGPCNQFATTQEKTRWPCPWNSNFSQYPTIQVGDNGADLTASGWGDSEHFRILSISPDAGNTLRVVAARNAVYDYCSYSPWHGQTNYEAKQNSTQLQHVNGWTLTMMPGQSNACEEGGNFIFNELTGAHSELDRDFTIHSASGQGPTGGINLFNSLLSMFDTSLVNLSAIPKTYVKVTEPAFAGNSSLIGAGGGLQSYLDDHQLAVGGYSWAVDENALVSGCPNEQLGCGVNIGMTTTGTANVYLVTQALGGLSLSATTYKTQPMIGWAGQNILVDVSNTSGTAVDTTPYSMCFVLKAGECHAGSSANTIYVNVPGAWTPYCSASISWANAACVMFGMNAPVDAIRQFRIYGKNTIAGSAADIDGGSSRFVSESWSSPGRTYNYAHSTVYPTGKWVLHMGSSLIDGYSMTGFLISLPPWQENTNVSTKFKNLTVKVPGGFSFAEVQFGYSRYIGALSNASNAFKCTSRQESCEAGSNLSPFAYAGETQTGTACSSGCTINVPVVGPNVVYYQIRQSNDGMTWTTGDIQSIAIQ